LGGLKRNNKCAAPAAASELLAPMNIAATGINHNFPASPASMPAALSHNDHCMDRQAPQRNTTVPTKLETSMAAPNNMLIWKPTYDASTANNCASCGANTGNMAMPMADAICAAMVTKTTVTSEAESAGVAGRATVDS